MKQRERMEINEKTSMLVLAGPIFMELLLNILLSNVYVDAEGKIQILLP